MLRDIEPTRTGAVVRDGQTIRFELFGEGERTLLLLPTWSIVHTDFWREQVPHFMDRYAILTFDGLGNGASDRPTTAAAYSDQAFAGDAIAVMDAAGVDVAVSMAVSRGCSSQLLAAAQHAERIAACVFIAPSVPLAPVSSERVDAARRFDEPLAEHPGWLKWNRRFWHEQWPEFLHFFFSKCFTEPESDAHTAHFVSMGLETTPAVVAATIDAPSLDSAGAEQAAQALACPALVIHGDGDEVAPVERGRKLAELARGELVVLPGSGHEPQCRIPVEVNTLLDHFLDEHFAP